MSIRCLGCMKLKEKSPVCEHCGYNENVPNYAHQLPIGTVLHGQYTVGKVLGQGGFGITYIGWDDALEAPVAIKEYYPNSFVTRECTVSTALSCTSREMEELFFHNRDRFLREARMLARLQDVPGIVRVHNLFRENNTAYIVMEYVEGIDLKRYIRTLGRTLTVGETLAVLRPVMDALSLVHQAELVHRDISPDNIMIRPDGSAKLLDFGAAREVENPDVEKNLSQSTESILKHGFAPIEQYQRRGNLGPWTDVYALCATVYYCLTGKVPADAPERMIEQAEVNWNAIPGLTPKQAEVFAKGMAVLPKDRIRSIRELYQSLRDSAGANQTQRRPVEHKPSKPVTKQEDPVSTVMETNRRGGSSTLPKDANTEQKKKKPILPITAAALALVAAVGLFAMKPKETPGTAAAPEIRPAATESAITEALSEEELRYQEAEALEAAGEYGKAAIAFGKLGDYADARERSFGLWDTVAVRDTVSIGASHMVAVKTDGTVVTAGNCRTPEEYAAHDIKNWKNVIAVCAVENGTFGLTQDGTVLYAGNQEQIRNEVSTWTDIVSISGNDHWISGIKSDGSTVSTNDAIHNFNDMIALDGRDIYPIGITADNQFKTLDDGFLRRKPQWKGITEIQLSRKMNKIYYKDGKIDTTRFAAAITTNGGVYLKDLFMSDKLNLSNWNNIVAINCEAGVLGLQEDGTVLTAGLPDYFEKAISSWQNIQQILVAYVGDQPYYLGLLDSGEVVTAGSHRLGNLSKWKDIVYLFADKYDFYNNVIGVKSDGTVITNTGYDTSHWKDIKLPNSATPNSTLQSAPTKRTYTQIATGLDHTVVLFSDGTVKAIGSNEYGQCDVEDWRNIIRISANDCLTMGLQSDGTVLLAGNTDPYGQEVYGWQNITDISAGKYHLLGLVDDGTVVSSGGAPRYADTSSWDDIVSIGTAYTNSVGLRENGTVVTKGTYRDGDLLGWNKIISISVSDAHILGLRTDGTVMAAGSNSHDQCDVDTWTDIIAVGAGCGYSVGLRGDGTVLVQGLNDNGQHEARSWKDIVYISVGLDHIIGVKADGTFVATGDNEHGECSVDQFNQ